MLIPLNARLAIINSSQLDDELETCENSIEEQEEDNL